MAEFCLDCWNRINRKKENSIKYVLSKETELCEGCREYKRVIVRVRKPFILQLLLKEKFQKHKTPELTFRGFSWHALRDSNS